MTEMAAKGKSGAKIVNGKSTANGRFVAGNKLGSSSAKGARLKRAHELMDEFGFDPLRARIVYFNELMDEANQIRDNLQSGVVVDLAGNEYKVVEFTGTGSNVVANILDEKQLKQAHDNYNSIRAQADALAASLMPYAYPQLQAVAINTGEAGTWSAIVQAMSMSSKEPTDG